MENAHRAHFYIRIHGVESGAGLWRRYDSLSSTCTTMSVRSEAASVVAASETRFMAWATSCKAEVMQTSAIHSLPEEVSTKGPLPLWLADEVLHYIHLLRPSSDSHILQNSPHYALIPQEIRNTLMKQSAQFILKDHACNDTLASCLSSLVTVYRRYVRLREPQDPETLQLREADWRRGVDEITHCALDDLENTVVRYVHRIESGSLF